MQRMFVQDPVLKLMSNVVPPGSADQIRKPIGSIAGPSVEEASATLPLIASAAKEGAERRNDARAARPRTSSRLICRVPLPPGLEDSPRVAAGASGARERLTAR